MRYINNFLAVHRVRPRDPEEDDRSDEDVSDEELEVSHACLAEALNIRIAGKESGDAEGSGDEAVGDSHKQSSTINISIAQQAWSSVGDGLFGAARGPQVATTTSLDKVVAAAKASRRKEKSLTGRVRDASARDGIVKALTAATPDQVEAWLRCRRAARSPRGKLLLNEMQYCMVEKVAPGVVEEMMAEAAGEKN